MIQLSDVAWGYLNLILGECFLIYDVWHLADVTAVISFQDIDQSLNTTSGHTFIGVGGQSGDTSRAGKMGIEPATILDCRIAQRRIDR